ncbi:MAG: hypothetical protein H6514_09520 [Acidimicrobiaceae bacterium]|nr:hypothetical protein [Acidimicrobiaceae bacterium]
MPLRPAAPDAGPDAGPLAGRPGAATAHDLVAAARPAGIRVRRPSRARVWLVRVFVLALLVAAGFGIRAWIDARAAARAIPTFDTALPAPTSYWTFRSESVGLDGSPFRMRAQRAPGSAAIVVELESGTGELDGSTVLMTPEGTWDFDRMSGRLSTNGLSDLDLYEVFEPMTQLLGFDDLVSGPLREHAAITSRTDLPTPQAGADGTLTEYVLVVDLARFLEQDRPAFRDWAARVGVTSATDDELEVGDLEPFDHELVVTVDASGTVWSWQLHQDGDVELEYRLLELSDGAFIPPDPAVAAPAAVAD